MSIRRLAQFATSNSIVPALALALASGCGAESIAPQAQAVQAQCEQVSDVLFDHDFASGVAGWAMVSSLPADPAHCWALENGSLRSDPAGSTLASFYNRADSPTFEPMGRSNLRLKVRMAYKVSGNNILQLMVGSKKRPDDQRALIADYNGQNPSYPAADEFEVAIPGAFSLDKEVFLSLLVQAGAGGDYGARVERVQVVGDGAGPGLVFGDSFGEGLGKWSVYSDPSVAGHMWEAQPLAAGCGLAKSDPAGETISENYTRLESRPFSLVGKSAGVVVVKGSYDLPAQGRYQVFIADMEQDGHRSLIGEFQGKSAGYPAESSHSFAIPADFLGCGKVRVAFLELTGEGKAQGQGISLSNVHVLAVP
jgi:hypothetical protein